MDSRQRTLDFDMAKWRDESLGCSKTGTLAQKTKGRQRILPTDWSATGRLIIPHVRDRWFKSSPRNQFLRGMLREQLFFCTKAALALHEWRRKSMLRVT